ncbi:hypothetical protein FRB94_006886 [Tulasnella sp. JGI-2019a]|nr:hypothetical protein FRB93_007030 [Tulasnella sp. JGI-2019a]KAG8998459.1 hypothetical protein FRB94_006886 [Tulasnella sp. JGI-2019a]
MLASQFQRPANTQLPPSTPHNRIQNLMQNLMASTLQQQLPGTPYQHQQYRLQSLGTLLPRYMGGFRPQNPNLI